MKYSILALAMFATSAAQAHDGKDGVHVDCDVHSQYSVAPYRSAFVFKREDGGPAEIGIGGGRLFIDGREATLSASDHQRLALLEQEMHQMVPELRKVAVEAVDIAFTALIEVARGLSSTPQESVAKLEAAHRRVRLEMNSRPLAVFNENAMADVVKPLLAEFVPQLVGGAVSSALQAVFSGEKEATAFERRMTNMERELDRKVEARAKALEPLADAMCTRLHRMDDIDDSLEFRLPDKQPLQLLRVEPHKKD